MAELLSLHPDIQRVMAGFRANELHAARAGRDVMHALAQTVSESPAVDAQSLSDEIVRVIDALLTVMPAYAPPLNVLHRVMKLVDDARELNLPLEELRLALLDASDNYASWSLGARTRIAEYGTNVIPENGTVYTHTLSETTSNTLAYAAKQGKRFSVCVTESRPNNDGLTTTRKMLEADVSVEVSIDAYMGVMIPQADLMMVGAEAIMADGAAVCKVGTYPAALIAKTHSVPVYVLVDSMKFNITSTHGLPLWMENLARDDILPASYPAQASVVGHLFDTTPPDLITALITENGLIHPADCAEIFTEMPVSTTLSKRLSEWAYGKQ